MFFFLENIVFSKEDFLRVYSIEFDESWEVVPILKLWGPLMFGTDWEAVTLSNGVGGEGSVV